MYRVFVLLVLLAPSAFSTSILFEADLVATSALIPGIAVGDQFALSLMLDYDGTDVDASTGFGRFPTAISAASLAPDPGNTGTWDPSVGPWDDNEVQTEVPDGPVFVLNGTGIPGATGDTAFKDLIIFFVGFPVTDSGSGDTLGTQLGSTPTAAQLLGAADFGFAQFVDAETGEEITQVFLAIEKSPSSEIPEPSAWLLLGTGLAVLAGYGRSRRRRRG
jgi:PEP-CTERM motif-containing protein